MSIITHHEYHIKCLKFGQRNKIYYPILKNRIMMIADKQTL